MNSESHNKTNLCKLFRVIQYFFLLQLSIVKILIQFSKFRESHEEAFRCFRFIARGILFERGITN